MQNTGRVKVMGIMVLNSYFEARILEDFLETGSTSIPMMWPSVLNMTKTKKNVVMNDI